ncbi:hypothetical protein QJS10_CPB14g00965 [Acorus calamus]|uniref:Uncharacterized protein n=1 Tax=Acorus calamus TaxID=4465 RepID=A0AAV9DEH0_ACOCL|nr:hypothetical protein QJS10_CPB14g00965 [Acorus calamus]
MMTYSLDLQLITRLVFERGSTDAAAKVADIMIADFVHEVISACVPPVYPPRSGHDSLASRSSNDAIMNAPDSDRLFYEFAHDQSERFPTLKWWIQMQSNLHRVSESSISVGGEAETVVRSKIKFAVKRCREPESDNESEVDETVVESLPVLANFNADDHRTSDFWHDSPGPENLGLGSTVFLSFDLENEVPYKKAVDKLISEGKLADALALSDRCLNEVCRYLHKWDLDAAMDILTMCGCHLPQSDPIRDEEDPEGLALRLAGKGAVSAAVEVAEGLQGRQLVKLLTADPLNGGGPAEASRFLSSLRDSEDALPTAMGAMQLLPILKEFPSLRDNNLILTYSPKAIAVSSNSPK